jgi:hypothetical protein
VTKEYITTGPNFDSFLVLWQGDGILLFVFSLRRCTLKKFKWLFKQAFTAWLQLRRSDERSPALTH